MVKINTTLRPIWFPWNLGCCLLFHPRLRLGRKINNNLGPKEIIYRPRVVLYKISITNTCERLGFSFPELANLGGKPHPRYYFSSLSLYFHYGFSTLIHWKYYHSQLRGMDGRPPLSIYTVCPNWEHYSVIFRLSFPHCMPISALDFPLSLHIFSLKSTAVSALIKAFPLFSSFLSCFFSCAVTLLKITFMLSTVKTNLIRLIIRTGFDIFLISSSAKTVVAKTSEI